MPSSAREEVAMKGPVRSPTPAAVGSLAVLLANLSGAHAVRPDECEQQRKLYPEVWADVSQEQALFECASHYAGSLRIKLGAADGSGRALMSLVALKWFGQTALEDPASGIFRIWLDREQVDRLKAGKYFATIVRREGSCWIPGNLHKDPCFPLASADPPAETPNAASLCNLARRRAV